MNHGCFHFLRPASLDGHDAAEIVPAEKDLDTAEADLFQKLHVLFQTIGDEHIFKRFALLGDLDFGVAVSSLEVVIVLDEQPVEGRILAGQFLNEEQAALIVQAGAAKSCANSQTIRCISS